MSLNIIKGNSDLEKILPFYINGAVKLYGYEYNNTISCILNNLNIYLISDDEKDACKVISELFGRDLTKDEKTIFSNNNDDILNGGILKTDPSNLQFYLAIHDDQSFKTEIELVRKIYVDILSSIKNTIINISGSEYLRNGFSFRKINELFGGGISFNDAVSKLFTDYIMKKTFYLSDDVYKSTISLEVAKFIFNTEYSCNNAERFIDSYLICEPQIWDLYEDGSNDNVNFFMMCNYLDQIEYKKDYSYIKFLKKELTEYKYNKSI